ncbi:MAG: hypothetical protein JO182_25735 [Acidobacteriaceae bacterium]|nr:hypothetical protein [Acidobacteriaceae bacterium]
MRKHLSHFSQLALLFVSAFGLLAQTQHITPFTGTWKVNLAKSKYSPGPPPRNAPTVSWAPDGTFMMEQVDDKGQTHKWTHPWSDGKEVPVQEIPMEGTQNDTVLSKYRDHTLDEMYKEGGKTVMTVHAVISPDGRTETATIHSTDEKGRPVHNIVICEKQ